MTEIESFFSLLGASNPFVANRVNGPSAADVDVDNIHALPFERLVALAREARDEERGLGAVLWGEAGVGKSHLLARLSRWANQDKNACFIYLHNLQASPVNLPRSLLKSVLSILTQGQVDQLAGTSLFRLVNAFVREAIEYDPHQTYSWPSARSAYDRLVNGLCEHDPSRAALVDHTVYEVLFRFFHSAYSAREGEDDEQVARLAVRWLAGDFIDADEATRLGVRSGGIPGAPVALADNQQLKQVLVALNRLARSRRQPFILCFDQMDNLDADQAGALARFLEALLDSSANLLVVIAGIQASLLRWRDQKVIQDSAWDRLAQFEIPLYRINVSEGRTIIAARLQRFLERFAELAPVRQHLQADSLFPLGQSWAEEFLKDKIELRPRDVVNWAREGWRREQEALRQSGGMAWLAEWGTRLSADGAALTPTAEQIDEIIDRKVAQKVAELKAQRQAAPEALPPDADNLAGLVYTLLGQCRHAGGPHSVVDVEQLPVPSSGPRPPYDLLVRQCHEEDGREFRTGILFLTTSNAATATTALRKIFRDREPPDRVFLVTDERRPLPLAAKGKEYLGKLAAPAGERFRAFELTFEQYTTLDALQGTVSLARSGDLEIELPGGQTRTVSDQEVVESHHRQRRYLNAPILHDVLAAGTQDITDGLNPSSFSRAAQASAE